MIVGASLVLLLFVVRLLSVRLCVCCLVVLWLLFSYCRVHCLFVVCVVVVLFCAVCMLFA